MMGIVDDLRNLIYALKRGTRDLLSYVAILMAILVGLFVIAARYGSSKNFAEQMLHKEQVAVRSGSSAVETTLDLIGRDLAVLADNLRAEDLTGSQEEFENFTKYWRDISDVILLDAEGELIAQSEGSQADIGEGFSDREYYNWAIEADDGEVFYGKPIVSRAGATEGTYIVVIATPVVNSSGNFRGVLAAGIRLEDLARCCISQVKFGRESEIYMVDNEGDFIYTTVDDLKGQNMFSFIQKNSFFGSKALLDQIRGRLSEGGEGKLDIFIPQRVGGKFPIERRLMAYSPVEVGDSVWYMVLSVPYSSVIKFIAPFAIRGGIFLLISFALLLFASSRFARLRGHQEGHRG